MARTIADLVQCRAGTTPERIAYTFLPDRGEPATLTYAQLADQAMAWAAVLAESGQRGDRVLILLPPGLKYIVALYACFHAGRIAVPSYPPHPTRLARALPAMEALCADAGASTALASTDLVDLVDSFRGQAPRLAALRWLAADRAIPDHRMEPTPHEIAILQYTSGSTSQPKGVILGHDNLLHNFQAIRDAFALSEETRGLFWLPPYHDMGLIAGILQPLHVGYPSILMSPASFAARPARWLESIARYRATYSGGPNFGYDLCVRKTTPEERARLDLSGWTLAFNGAEPVRADTLDRFAAAFAVSGFQKSAFMPCYGLAEATLLVSCGDVTAEPVVLPADTDVPGGGRIAATDTRRVSCGRPAGGQTVVVADPVTGARVADGTVGEVWVSGPSVARGYWRRPNDPTFEAALPDEPGRVFVRTGDLAVRAGDELVITGRNKDLIIVRGRNFYPQDLELAAERAHPAIQEGGVAAFTRDVTDGGNSRIVIACEVRRRSRTVDPEAVGRDVRRAIAARFELAVASVVLLGPGTIPKTTSGKIRRGPCRAMLDSGDLRPIHESRATVSSIEGPSREQILAASGEARVALIAELIGALAARHGAPETGASLLDLVTDSIEAVEIATELQTALGVDVALSEVIGDVRLADLATRLAERMETPPADAPDADPSQLSFGQSALWLVQRLNPSSTAYNTGVALRLSGRLDEARVVRAIAAVSARHAQLRIAVAARDGRPYAIEAPLPELIRIGDGEDPDVDATIKRVIGMPFDLGRGPLWRVALIDGAAPVIILCVHHLIADYASLDIIVHDLDRALRLGDLPATRLSYTTLAAAHETPERLAAKRAFWARELAAPPVLDLPSPRARPVRTTHAGTQHEVVFSTAAVRAMRALAHAERTTLHVVLMAGLHAFLRRWTGQEDVVIGMPVTTRRHAFASDLVGYCVNPVPVRAHPAADRPFVELLREVRDQVIAAIAHELPFPSLVEAVAGERDPTRTPVFQVLLALEKAQGDARAAKLIPLAGHRFQFADFDAEPLLVRPSHVPFDLTVLVEESALGLAAAIQVAHDALDGSCAVRVGDQWVRLLEGASRAPDVAIGHLPLISPEERAFVVHDVNHTAAPFRQECLHRLVAEQAARTPEATAVIDGEDLLSYRELMRRASALAHHLRAKGARPETRVGLYMHRGAGMVVATLGILGAGATYVYLDPRYPPDRVAFVLEDAGLATVVTTRSCADAVPGHPTSLINLEDVPPSPDPRVFPDSEVSPENLAYVIYTSGSTGQPKGVAIEHRNAAALIGWAHGEYAPAALRGVLAATSLAFDLSIFELFVPLSGGGTVIIAETALDLPRLPARDQVTLINTVPSAMTELIAAGAVPPSVRIVNLAGEPLTAALAAAVHAVGHVDALYNLYGPTEDTTYSTFERVEPGATPTLGRPLANRAAYILDPLRQPVPIGVVGEIWLGGAGITRGYLNRPAMTEERFVQSTMPDAPGRLYRTGDLGRRMRDGRIEYLGRRDRQVKIRGFRIELEEIVAALVSHPAVADAAVMPDEAQRLLAFVGSPDGAEPSVLRAYLEARLPPFMVPNLITVMPRLPLTPNRKVDYQALTGLAPPARAVGRSAPSTPTEASLADMWREILGVQPGMSDDFFALGGHSLLAARLQTRVHSHFGVDLPLRVMFERPTIERLSRVIEAAIPTRDIQAPPRIKAVPRGHRRFEDLGSGVGAP